MCIRDSLSTVAFGRVRPAKDEQEKRRALELMIDKYSKGFEEGGRKYINASVSYTHLTSPREKGN